MNTFNKLYSDYYDLMYADKAYDTEMGFVTRALQEGDITQGSILSLGAGTLNYEARLGALGFTVHGVEISPHMAALAQEKIQSIPLENVTVDVGDMRTLPQFPKEFDAAVILFNVLGYCDGYEDVEKVFSSVAKNLRVGGVFVLDCWNSLAVRKSPPQSRWKKFIQGETELYRLTDAQVTGNERVELSIELLEVRKDKIQRATEVHRVHSWELEKLTVIAEKNNLSLVHSGQFPEWNLPVSDDAWSMGLVFKKK